jgi:3-oxoacyl-[acyl-carrier-protein] synthase II
MLENALAAAGLEARDIDYINAHGTGTVLNDETESAFIERTFGKKPLVNSTKSLIGHTIGASGAIEAAVTALSLRDQKTHPSKNIDNPLRDLSFVRSAEPIAIRHALSQSFAFGGHNACLVFSRAE